MPRPANTHPTEIELKILQILWQRERATAREIHEQFIESRQVNYSTTVKMLAIMLDKGLVTRDKAVRPMTYRAACSRESTQVKMLGNLIKKVYDGSAASLVLQALSSTPTSSEELAKIRALIQQLEGDNE